MHHVPHHRVPPPSPTTEKQDRLLAEVARVLRPGGMFAGADNLDPPEFRDLHVDDICHGYIDDVLGVLLHPYAQEAGLVGTGPFNMGRPDDYRVPDRAYHRGRPSGTSVATAAIVVEIVSPDDETYDKFAFCANHGVDEIIVADPSTHLVTMWRRISGASFQEGEASALLVVSAAELTAAISWPE